MKFAIFFCAFVFSLARELVLVFEINRHGARVPKVLDKDFGVIWPWEASFVTPIGINMHREIGV